MARSAKPRVGPRPLTRRGWVVLGAAVAVAVAAFSVILAMYNAEGGSRVVSELGPTSDRGLVITLEPVSVDATRGQAVVHGILGAQGDALIDEVGRLRENTRIVVYGYNGATEVKFPAGSIAGQFETTVGLDGDEVYYPFDVHVADFSITADTYRRNTDGSLDSTGTIPLGIQGIGGVSGWDSTFDLSTELAPVALASITYQRAFSTQAFAVLILLLATVLSVLSLLVGVLVFSRRRPAEVALLSWTAALLFALPLLRNYMPNGPPVGVALDVYAYLWIIAMAVAGSVLVILGWLGQRRDELLADEGGDHAA